MIYPLKYIGLLIDLCWLVFIVYWAINFYGNKQDIYKRNFSTRILGVIIIILVSGISSKYHLGTLNAIIPYNQFTQILGVLVCALGVAYAIWARKILSTNWSAFPTVKKDHQLVQSGPYGITRHPIYTGILLAFLGTFLAISPTFPGLALIVFAIIWLGYRIKKEEKLMTQTFPNEYPAYKQKVRHALIPYIY